MSRSAMIGALALTCLAALIPADASATQKKYKAGLVAECCSGETIESGATEKQFFTLRNEGTATWGEAGGLPIALRTDVPRAPSEFAAGDWLNPETPLEGVASPVKAGESYKFVFDVRAPSVSMPTTFTEHFGLLAGTSEWMDAGAKGDAQDPSGPDLTLTFAVVPAQPPAISLSVSPTAVSAGDSFDVDIRASSVASVNRVVVQYGSQSSTSVVPRNPAVAEDEQTSWSPVVAFTAGGSGQQTLAATAYDDAGLSATATATVEVKPAPTAAQLVVGPFATRFSEPAVRQRAGHLRLTRVTVNHTTRGERVVAYCEGCRGASRLGPVTATGGDVVFKPRRLIVTGRSRLSVYVTAGGMVGRFKVYGFDTRTEQFTLPREGCLAPASTDPIACPG